MIVYELRRQGNGNQIGFAFENKIAVPPVKRDKAASFRI